jgi:hypothetical protein
MAPAPASIVNDAVYRTDAFIFLISVLPIVIQIVRRHAIPDVNSTYREGFLMWRGISLGLIGCMIGLGSARAEDPAPLTGPLNPQESKAAQPQEKTPKTAVPPQGNTPPAAAPKQNDSLQEALARNAREIQALKEQYARDMEQQRKRAELQQRQIEILQQTANLLAEQLKKQAAAPVSSQAIEKLDTKTELLESRAQQAARRDQELASATDSLREKLDSEIRNGPRLPAPLKELFDGNYTNETPVSIFGQMLFGYNKQNGQNGNFTTMQVSPYFLVQLNKRFLVEASIDLNNGLSPAIGNAQIDILLNKWMTLNIGRFITPIGQFNLWYNHEWINRLPDPPLMFNQVSPPTSTDGIQLSGASYLGALPLKFTYQLYFGNGVQVSAKPSNYGQAADLAFITGGPEEVSSQAYGGRFGLWMPRQGINMGVSGYSNGIYNPGVPDHFQVWGWDFTYHRGNWYFLSEFADNYQQARGSIGNNVDRRGLYAQLSYRDYNNRSPYLAKLEGVFRYSFANFSGINFGKLDTTASPFAAGATPVDTNQYTFGINYWFYASNVLKFAYEINQEVNHQLNDHIFMAQWAWFW